MGTIDLAGLARHDTPTVCNALAAVVPGAQHHTRAPLACALPARAPIVGFARTAIYRTLGPSAADRPAREAADAAYVDYVAAGEGPRIVVIQDGDSPVTASHALFGDVMSHMHAALGCLGLVTNGAVRDVAGMADGFQVLHAGVAPARGHHHRAAFDCEVNVAGMYARTDDVIHADRNGAAVVPRDRIAEVVEAADAIAHAEQALIDYCQSAAFTVDGLKDRFAKR